MQLSYLHLNFIRSIPASWDGESLNTVTEHRVTVLRGAKAIGTGPFPQLPAAAAGSSDGAAVHDEVIDSGAFDPSSSTFRSCVSSKNSSARSPAAAGRYHLYVSHSAAPAPGRAVASFADIWRHYCSLCSTYVMLTGGRGDSLLFWLCSGHI
jgi:hypothetical protein